MELAKAEEIHRKLLAHNEELKLTSHEHLDEMEQEVFDIRKENLNLKAEVEIFVKVCLKCSRHCRGAL